MKCKNCDHDLFPGQFQCQYCGTVNPTVADKPKETKKSKSEKK